MTGYIMAGLVALSMITGAVGYFKGRTDGKASIERELVAARERHRKDKIEFDARLNRLAGSIKRRCARGEPLPECRDLER